MSHALQRSVISSPSVPGRRARASRGASSDVLQGIPLTPASAAEAFDCLALVGARLRAAGDPRAAFTDVYAIITRRVRDALRDTEAPVFDDPRFISRLAGRFCQLYLAALRRSCNGEREPIAAWAEADRRERWRRTLPVQHALLGLNAHINYDLAVGLFANVEALGLRDATTLARYKHDHDAVNRILEEALPEVLELLAERYGCPVARGTLAAPARLRRAACGATLFTLRAWRARVWDDLLAMLDADERGGVARVEARMDGRAGLLARLLGFPLPAL